MGWNRYILIKMMTTCFGQKNSCLSVTCEPLTCSADRASRRVSPEKPKQREIERSVRVEYIKLEGRLFDDVKEMQSVIEPLSPEVKEDPFFSVKLKHHSELEYGFGPRFVAYTIEVKNKLIWWTIRKRYSEFKKLNEKLQPLVNKHKIKLSKFPKRTWRRKLDKEFVEERQGQLENWLKTVVNYDVLSATPLVMEFLGALQDLNKIKKEHRFQQMPIRSYINKAQTGDVILFRTIGILSSGLRVITTCEYDHVAMVIVLPSNWSNVDTWNQTSRARSAYLLEATADGVDAHRLKPRLKQWHLCDAQIVFRGLNYNRDEEYEKQAFEFAKSATGKNYGFRFTEIVRRKSFDELEDRSAFFCSELVAAFYKKVGLLPLNKSANAYYPSSFTGGRGPELLKGAKWGEETLLTFNIPGVAKSYQRRDSGAKRISRTMLKS